MATAKNQTKQAKPASSDMGILFIFSYLLTWLSGIIVYITEGQKDKRQKFHALQAIMLGIILTILSFIPFIGWIILLFGWLYGLYVGWKAYNGTDLEMPLIGKYAKDYSK